MGRTPKKSSAKKNQGKKKQQDATQTSSASNHKPPTRKPPRVLPPWSVVSPKDMAQNLELERERRRIAQEKEALRLASDTDTVADPPDMRSHVHNTQGKNKPTKFRKSKSVLSNFDQSLLSWKPLTLKEVFNPRRQVRFLGSFGSTRLMPPRMGVPEIAFMGRSNVGKSSLLNRLVGFSSRSSNIARVGKTPGATASVNLYGLYSEQSQQNEKQDQQVRDDYKGLRLGLVDLPGFGYARRIDKEKKDLIDTAAGRYLNNRKELMLSILLVDSRRVPTDQDRELMSSLFEAGMSILVVATKIDKLSSNERDKCLKTIQDMLELPEHQPFAVSSITGEGIKELWRILLDGCESGVADLKAEMVGEQDDDEDENNDDYVENDGEFDDAFLDDDSFEYHEHDDECGCDHDHLDDDDELDDEDWDAE
eukprot:Nitzschia sp. Nitz4//scaffold5_size260463//172262//173527//NITZ4_000999-RA/size260463-processed-gene-0.139-mRNA-1//-1//CDS//3329555391//9180//frame0